MQNMSQDANAYICTYVQSKNVAIQSSNVVALFKDGGFWLQFPIFFIAVFVLSIIVIFGQGYFETKTVRISSVEAVKKQNRNSIHPVIARDIKKTKVKSAFGRAFAVCLHGQII